MAAPPRMRHAEGVYRELKAADPDTRITLHFIRGLIKSGEIPVVHVGCQKLVNVDQVFDYLANKGTTTPIQYGTRKHEGAGA